VHDGARVYARLGQQTVRARPQLRGAGEVGVGVVGDDAGAARQRLRAQQGRDDDTGGLAAASCAA